MSDVADDAFGRFLENQMNTWREIGVEAERERIIKLLDSLWDSEDDRLEPEKWNPCVSAYLSGIEKAQQAVEGENK